MSPSDESHADGYAALAAGRWVEARSTFEQAFADDKTGESCFGLAVSLWWLALAQLGHERLLENIAARGADLHEIDNWFRADT